MGFRIISGYMVLLFMLSTEGKAQLQGNNLAEYQLGNTPGSDPADLSTFYNRLNLLYRYGKIRASLRYEQFNHPDPDMEYYRLSQYNLNYRDKGLELQVGHFNETLGNGILLRSFEIPGSIYEDQAFRVRHGFYRDLNGFSASYNHRFFRVKALRARTLFNLFPPTIDEKDRRPDLTEAFQAEGRILNQTPGIIFLRNHNSGKASDYLSFFLKGSLTSFLSYNAEFAKGLDEGPYFRFDHNSSYGVYASLNLSAGPAGLSLEYKNYQNIFIGSGISDPPTLVKEQIYKVLNRSIHVPDLTDESGIQAELFINTGKGDMLTLNYARTLNELFEDFVFEQYFLEYQFGIREYDNIRVFVDYSKDPFKRENQRYSAGFLTESVLRKEWGVSLQAEYQFFERKLGSNPEIDNTVLILSIFKSSDFSLSLVHESSTDPQLADRVETMEVESGRRHWWGTNIAYEINKSNKLSLFAGQRRGGPACTSGICYKVLDFEGVELRLTTKF